MKIYVCVKQVPDTETKIKIKDDSSGIDEAGIKWVMNPYDEYAVEEALKLKESKGQGTVTVISVGPKARIVDAMRTALAMGADDGIAIDAEPGVDASLTAQALAAAIQKEGAFDLIFSGRLAIDDNGASVSQILAELLNVPHSTVVSKFDFSGNSVRVERETEGGAKEVVQMQTPCLVAANKGLNMPRYASLPGIMKAKKKPIKELSLKDLCGASGARTAYGKFQLPPQKPAVKFMDGDSTAKVQQLVRLLREEAKVI